jgi:hypothetical protein
MSQNRRVEPYEVHLYKATVRLSAATDTCYVLATDVEDAVRQIRHSFADLNVLYVVSIERVSGTVYVSGAAHAALTGGTGEPSDGGDV